ncbi:inactive peptidyl-prolyl cis-trans isomerase FKBP6-like [Achroia grisella]|uniref:inactive peptidyl-prolyl cis-trans isomerase FKBP6-like n=1 Tax=Achroia grisella TaxID=688607 RepID=UPI0027D21AF1|nr:inactive peptidyl-prolyl cis-trans isomerase FKBP6-like [Achroia grisella]
MESKSSPIVLENGLDLRQVTTTGSLLHINQDYNEIDNVEYDEQKINNLVDFIGTPIKNLEEFEQILEPVDKVGFVKKKIVEEGGGQPLSEEFTVSVAFSGYWENEPVPFDLKPTEKPLVVNLKDNALLPGLEVAIKSMLVGELSVFLLSYQVMYGEMGIPPRIKPKAKCIFYIKLVKSILSPKDGPLDFSESNMFQRILKEVKMLYSSGVTLHKTNNFCSAIQLFKKSVVMLHKCRLADASEEYVQEKMLIKLYINLAICYNKTKQPLKACISCNELNRLNSLWNNEKALFQNAKALRMIGQFDHAEKKLKRAMKLHPNNEDMKSEMALIVKTRDSCNQNKIIMSKNLNSHMQLITDNFKHEVDILIKNFKDNINLTKLSLPEGLNSTERAYIRESCIRENLFFSKIRKGDLEGYDEDNYVLDKDNESLIG